MLKLADKNKAAETGAAGGSYAIDWSSAEERINKCKSLITNTNQQLDPERLRILKEVYQENQGEETILIRARLLERLLLQKKIHLDSNPVVGTLTGIPCGVYAYPEWSCDWIKDEMDLAKICSLGEIVIPEETKGLMLDIYKIWKGRSCRDVADRNYKEIYGENPRQYIRSGMLYDVGNNALGSGCANYSLILNKGARAVINDVDERIRQMEYISGSYKKMAFYRAVKIVMEAFIAWAHRYADLAEEAAAAETGLIGRVELLEIAEVCRRVPEYPARNFREAVQSFWFTHLLVEMEQMGCANSPGRYGQWMYPFYKKDVEEGRITREQAEQLIRFQFIRHTELGAYSGMMHQQALSGHTGQTIALGGLTPDGKNAANELEMVIMDAQIKMRNIQPTLALWFTPLMDDAYLMKAVEIIRTGCGQPQFMNTAIAVQRHLARFAECGITLQDARNCANFGCVSSGIAEKGSFVAVEDSVCLAKFVELALYNGWDPITKKQLGPQTGDPRRFSGYEEFYGAVLKQMDAGLTVHRRHSNLACSAREHIVPSVFRSALHDGCIENGIPEEAGGHRYPQAIGIVSTGVDAGNALHVIKELLYDSRRITVDELIQALEADWAGFEDIRRMCLNVPKYGNDDPESDAYVQRVYKDFADLYASKGPDYFGHEPRPDAYSLSFHNLYGSIMNATADGRRKGEAFTDASVSATPGSDKEGPTALIRSAARAIDCTWFASNHFNMKFLPSALAGPGGARMLLNLIKAYFDEGGSHIQFNCVERETLTDAQLNPQNHKDLVIRVAGFSAYFTRLDKGVQDEIIRRTEYR